MRVDNIDAWLVQETWLDDDDFDTDIEGYHLFRHNSPIGTTGRDHLFRGIAIILSQILSSMEGSRITDSNHDEIHW